jgi:hypothetical protein
VYKVVFALLYVTFSYDFVALRIEYCPKMIRLWLVFIHCHSIFVPKVAILCNIEAAKPGPARFQLPNSPKVAEELAS